MAISLYDGSVKSYLQTLAAVSGFLDRGLAYCREKNLDPEEIVETRLYPDMLPFRFQVQSVVHHSLGAIEGIKKRRLSPASRPPATHDYPALQALVADARAMRSSDLTPAAINAYEGGTVIFEFRNTSLPFTTEEFLLSFSLPNFHFHATTAYDILRSKGVPLGKRDYLGALRLKTR
jgi:hypothetical protein